ncbi:MAG: GntR family transcriptional regulator [Planctomycetes bacterium]|nr:GntR family transcriptional regulator [Planctomycetota bacterium]
MEKIDSTSTDSYYLQLEKILIKRIKEGDFKPLNRLPTVKDLSKIYEVAQLTVRRAIQDLTERGFIYKRRGKGIFIREDFLNLHLTDKKECVILVLLPSLMDPEGVNILAGIEKGVQNGQGKDIRLDIKSYEWKSKRQKSYLTKFISGNYSGLLFRPDQDTSKEYIQSVVESGKPFILIDRYFPGLPTNVVTMNYSQIAYLMTALLIKNRKKRICYLDRINPISDTSSSCNFIRKGYLQAMQDFRVPEQRQKILSGLDRDTCSDEEIEIKILNFLKANKDIDAFLLASGYTARKLLSASKKIRYKVLSDTQIAGFDLDPSLAYEGIPFITANIKHMDMGFTAMNKMSKLLTGEEGPIIREFIRFDLKRYDGYRNYERIEKRTQDFDGIKLAYAHGIAT